jgi:hypothetical protein
MQVISNCWSSIETYNCQYGAHLFDGTSAKIYVHHWLDVESSLRDKFSKRNDAGFVGHCLLVFLGVKKFDIEVTTHSKQGDETVWSKPVSFSYSGSPLGNTSHFYCEGSLHGFPSSVSLAIDAQGFELHILDSDEPVKCAG